MGQALWEERQPPPGATEAATGWVWALSTPMDVTVFRGDLRADLMRGSLPMVAERDDVDRLLLAFEELASNGLRHGRAPVCVRVVPTDDGWLIDVTDAAFDCPPTPAADRDPGHGGLGLHLVARMCAAHGWIVEGGRKHVWARVLRD